jgi:hypothetical protein
MDLSYRQEQNHRVRNYFQMILSILAAAGQSAAEPARNLKR